MRSQRIQRILENELSPSYLSILNESHLHSVPPNSESHFRVRVLSDSFAKLSSVQRQQLIYRLLDEELKSGLHALALELFSPVLFWPAWLVCALVSFLSGKIGLYSSSHV